MNLEEASFAILEELKRLRSDGVREIYLEDNTLGKFQNVLNFNFSTENEINKRVVQRAGSEILPEGKDFEEDKKKSSLNVVSSLPPRSESVKNEKKFLKIPDIILPEGNKKDRLDWLEKEVKNCQVALSEINEDGTIHFGRGNPDAELFFCGDAPSEEDDENQMVFGGESGRLLVKIIETMGFSEESVYLSNLLHWCPKNDQSFGDRAPNESEIKFSFPYLAAQIKIIKPKIIILLGKVAVDGFLGFDSKRRLSDVRGEWNQYGEVPLMITYHPTYLLHNPSKSGKRKVWEDMLKVMEKIDAPISEKQRSFFL